LQAGALARVPLVLEGPGKVRVELAVVVARPERLAQPLDGRPIEAGPSQRCAATLRLRLRLSCADSFACSSLMSLTQQGRLTVAGDQAGEAVQEPAVVVAVDHDGAEPQPVPVARLDQLELAHGEAQLVSGRGSSPGSGSSRWGRMRSWRVDFVPQPLV